MPEAGIQERQRPKCRGLILCKREASRRITFALSECCKIGATKMAARRAKTSPPKRTRSTTSGGGAKSKEKNTSNSPRTASKGKSSNSIKNTSTKRSSPARRKKPSVTASSPSKKASPVSNTLSFYLDDFGRTLFPLLTNKILISRGEEEVRGYIEKCLDDREESFHFIPQQRVYAAKPGKYIRRTVKLDPVAEYYIYDVIFRNRKLFRKPHTTERSHYGYRFEGGGAIAPTSAYKAFKGALSDYSDKFSNSLGMDVASYFNNIYHHDIISWFAELGASNNDIEGLGQLLREINSGRSIDCLPQGLYPTKMIGNDFLRFIDNYHDLKSDQIIRFMDDIYLFSDSMDNLSDDFQSIQRLLGDKGLSVNPRKTQVGNVGDTKIDDDIDEVKKSLLRRRRFMLIIGYDDDGGEIVQEELLKAPLSKKEMVYIDEILENPKIEEDDAELMLTIMRGHVEKVEGRLPYIVSAFPHLAKNVHNFCAGVEDKEFIANMLIEELKSDKLIMEYQLFWFCSMLGEYLMETSKASALIQLLFNHRSATNISRAKILEISDNRFGLPELRDKFLLSGQSNWLAWASAVGTRNLKATSRNHKLKYFGSSSQINHLIASVMMK